ncbi:MAG: methylated-DNA--[protein]-cysteine S-methyltransferase [Anaerolineae bacterium]|nr:methylated-DNA--[protein]-cysteine S-methyltransferase [Anaerolineae bacterium]
MVYSENYLQSVEDYARVEQAILFLQQNFQRQPSLKEVADAIGLSEYHFQRLFSRWAGISPKRFLQFLTVEHAKCLLTQSKSVLDVSYEAGLSGPGRLHDLFVTCEAITPGDYKRRGSGVEIRYGFHPSPFGECLLAVTERGVCALDFTSVGGREAALAALRANWGQGNLVEDSTITQPFADQIFDPVQDQQALPLVLKGTNFQIKVWQALLKIPSGAVVSYADIASTIGQPKASRAVGNAVSKNPIGYVIPCHRVIRKAGNIGDYHWGAARKQAMLGWESSRTVSLD